MNLIERVQSPTPKFFKSIRNIGLILASISGTLLAMPAALPLVIVKIAAYMGVAGAVASAVSQTAVTAEPAPESTNTGNGT